jgi:hypothetical protein
VGEERVVGEAVHMKVDLMEGAVDETTMRREARGGEEERDERA